MFLTLNKITFCVCGARIRTYVSNKFSSNEKVKSILVQMYDVCMWCMCKCVANVHIYKSKFYIHFA